MNNLKISFILLGLIFMNIPMQAQNKILIAYYSWSGNTRYMAEQIKKNTNADIFEIVPANAYPEDYNACVDQAKKEINSNFKPALKSKLASIDAYDIIIVGSPNWWSTFAPPVVTFLSGYNFTGKAILPFITHEGSRMGKSVEDIKRLCPNSEVRTGLSINGSEVTESKEKLKNWLEKTI